MAPGTPTPRAHIRTAPGRVSRPSTAPTPTTDSAPSLLPASSPIPSRQASPSPAAASLSPAPPASTPSGGPGSAPATAGAHSAASNGALDWHSWIQGYANGEWDPNRIPDPPLPLARPAPRNQSSPSPLLASSALSSSSTVAISYSPDSVTADSALLPASLGGLAGPDRPRISPESRTTSIASRRGTATPDLSSSPATFKNNFSPYVQAPRKVQRSQSDVEVRSPGGMPAATTPALPSPSIDRATTAATIRWAGAGVDVAPYALPSPEAAELLDPMRNAHPLLNMSSNAPTKSRLSKFWQGSPQYPNTPSVPGVTSVSISSPRPVTNPSTSPQPKRASTTVPTQQMPTLHADYFGSVRSQSHRSSRSPSYPERQGRTEPSSSSTSQSNPTVSGALPATSWSDQQPGPSQTNLVDSCSVDPFLGTTLSVADSHPDQNANPRVVPGAHSGNGYPAFPDHLLTSLSSSGDGAEFFTPSETLVPKADEEQDRPAYLIPPPPPDELERRKALYRFNILHTSRDVNFDRITHLCKLVFSTKIVIISLIDADKQWFKSEHGIGTDSTDRKASAYERSLQTSTIHDVFCLQRGAEPLIVLDAQQDWRFADNPLVVGPPYIRFYAGAPLRTSDGYNVGSLCVIDDRPHEEFTPRQRHTLKELLSCGKWSFGGIRRGLYCILSIESNPFVFRFNSKSEIASRLPWRNSRVNALSWKNPGHKAPTRWRKSTIGRQNWFEAEVLLGFARSCFFQVKRALDVEGALVLDITNLECVETINEDGTKSYSYRGDTFTDPSHAQASVAVSPSVHGGADKSKSPSIPEKPFERISTPVVLGASHDNFKAKHTPSISGADHERLSTFLSYYSSIHPTPPFQPATTSSIFSVDHHHPFALLCAYITDPGKHLLEGYELQFLRAIGVIILSAVLKRRMILADKAKSLFISNIPPALTTFPAPLHGILAAAELIADTKLTSTQSAFLKTIQSCGASLGETVNHVLDFTKLSGNREHTIPRSKTNLLALVEETVEGCWIGARARAVSEIGSVYSPPRGLSGATTVPKATEKRHVETVVDIGFRERGWSCICEKAGIRRVLMNLIGNALKFTSDGYVYVGLREVAYQPGSQVTTVELSVNDTGKGISKDFLTNQLFQPFSQVSPLLLSKENPLHTGTGLGLAIVNSIVRSETVDGQVDVWSQEGVGTEIKISFDVDETPASEADISLTSGKFENLRVCLLGFSQHRGQQELRSIIFNMLTEWWGADVTEDTSDASIVLVNEDVRFLSDLIDTQEFSKPVVLLSSGRGDQRIMTVVKAFERFGGCCRLIFKPGGPSRLFSVLQECAQFCAGSMHVVPGAHDLPDSPGSSSLAESKTNSYQRATSPRLSSSFPPLRPGPGGFHDTSRSSLSEMLQCNEEPQQERTLNDFSTVPLADEGSVMLESVTGSLNAIKKPRVLVVVNVLAVEKQAKCNADNCDEQEDNHINRNLLAHWLKKRNIKSDEAVDGVQGVKAYRNAPGGYYSVLLVDLSMPNLGGIGCVTQIRAIERARQPGSTCAKIFALTGLATPDDKRRALAAGFDGYLIKPVSFKTLDGLFQKLASG
ncbi:His Kinase A domain containing protein [Ceratobasidium sp. 414]|nr:His Kinase A domain containing protein [Ceratobasidium sp. 414]